LHHALQKHVGSHAQQQGSKVDDDWLRFDFTHLEAVGDEQLAQVATEVSARIAAAQPIRAEVLPLAVAREQGAMMLFGEKYPDPVRMVSMGEFSRELCGGTHLDNTGDVACFEILAEEAVSAGTRRVVALTGQKARQHAQQMDEAATDAATTLLVTPFGLAGGVENVLARQRALKKQLAGGGDSAAQPDPTALAKEPPAKSPAAALSRVAKLLSVGPLEVPDRVRAIQNDIRALEARLAERAAAGPLSADALLEQAESVGGATVVVAEAAAAEANLMRQLIDQIRKKADPAAVLLASKQGDDKAVLVAGVSQSLIDRGVHAGKWIGPVAKALGGGGGGRPDMAQAGGKQPEKLPQALELAKATVAGMLGE
jgi:alanyl-tRNA synthetase